MRFCLILIFCSIPIFAKKKYYIDRDTTITNRILWQITGSFGFLSTSGSEDFFSDYNRIMNRTQERFETQFSYRVGIRIFMTKYARMHISGEYYQAKFLDSYFEPFTADASTGRSLSQVIRIDEMPILANVELIPFKSSQFRSYIGLGAGLSQTDIRWRESVGTDASLDPRSTGIRYDNQTLSPIFRFILGTELNFDKYGKKTLLGSLFIETNFSYLYRQIDLFSGYSELSDFLLQENVNFTEFYNLNNISLQIKIGLSLNFYKNNRKA